MSQFFTSGGQSVGVSLWLDAEVPVCALQCTCVQRIGGEGVFPGKHTWRTSTEAAQDCVCWWGPFSHPLPMTCLCVTRICSHLSVCNSRTGESILSLTSREALGSALDIFSHCWTQWLARVSSREFSQFKMEHSVMKMLHSLRLW